MASTLPTKPKHCRFCDGWGFGYAMRSLYSTRARIFVYNKPPTTCQLVYELRRLRLLRSVTTSARRRQIFNKLNTRVMAVTSWLRREIAMRMAQPALPGRNRRSTGALRLRRKYNSVGCYTF